jgi:hypothetical protein
VRVAWRAMEVSRVSFSPREGRDLGASVGGCVVL